MTKMKAVPANTLKMKPLLRGAAFITILAMSAVSLQAHDATKASTLKVKFRKNNHGQVLLYWKGKIRKPMARSFKRAIERWKGRAKGGFIISLNSSGGFVSEANKVVTLLKKLKRTRTVRTYVGRGRTCGSMCVPIFLTGNQRIAAGASLWLFHDIAGRDKNDKSRNIFKPWKTRKMFNEHFIPAGVSKVWIDDIQRKIDGSDYWMTGDELYSSNANIITQRRGNRVARKLKALARR